jgi:hypothetical protein
VDDGRRFERGADRADAAVHHVAGRDHVGAGAACDSACCTSASTVSSFMT